MTFRQDLFHRIYVLPLCLPPLRDRIEDIPVLAQHFAEQIARLNGWKPKCFQGEAIAALQQYHWPGNVRELRNVTERLLLLAESEVDLTAVRLALPQMSPGGSFQGQRGPLAERVREFERESILAELKGHDYRMTETAQALGLERSHLYKKCQQLEIDLKSEKNRE